MNGVCFIEWCLFSYFASVLLEGTPVLENQKQFEENPQDYCEEGKWTSSPASLFDRKSS